MLITSLAIRCCVAFCLSAAGFIIFPRARLANYPPPSTHLASMMITSTDTPVSSFSTPVSEAFVGLIEIKRNTEANIVKALTALLFPLRQFPCAECIDRFCLIVEMQSIVKIGFTLRFTQRLATASRHNAGAQSAALSSAGRSDVSRRAAQEAVFQLSVASRRLGQWRQ